MPVGMMGQGMLPQNLGVLGMPSFYGQSFPQQGTQMPGGYPGIKMANIEVHKTGLFGRPKQYSMTFDYNTADPVKEAAEVTKSAVTSVVDEEATKEQEGKPNAKEEVKVIEAEAEASTKRLAKTPEEKEAYKKFLEKKKQQGMTIDEMVKAGLGTKKGLEALLGSDSESSSEMSSGLPTMGTWQDYSANVNAHLGQSSAQSTTDPAIALLEDEIASLEQMVKVGQDRGKTDSKLYKDNEVSLNQKKKELADRTKLLKKGITNLSSDQVAYITNPTLHGRERLRAPLQFLAGEYGNATEQHALEKERLRYVQQGPSIERAFNESLDLLPDAAINTASALSAAALVNSLGRQAGRYFVRKAMPTSYGRAIYTPPAGAPALGPGRAALPQFPGRPVPQIGSAPTVRGYLPEGNLPAGTQLRMPFQQGGMTNPFTYNPLSEFVYGGSLNKYQIDGETDEEETNASSPSYMTKEEYEKAIQEYELKSQKQMQEQMQQLMNQQHMRGQFNPYGYANTDYGRVPTTFNPYGRGPGIRRAGTWMQQTGLPMDAQGNPITDSIAGQPLTKFAVTKSGLFGNPRRYEATWGTPQGSTTSTNPILTGNAQDERRGFMGNLFNRDNQSTDNIDSKGRIGYDKESFDKTGTYTSPDNADEYEKRNARYRDKDKKRLLKDIKRAKRKDGSYTSENPWTLDQNVLKQQGGVLNKYQIQGQANEQRKSISSQFFPESSYDFPNPMQNKAIFGDPMKQDIGFEGTGELDNPWNQPWEDK